MPKTLEVGFGYPSPQPGCCGSCWPFTALYPQPAENL